MTEQLTIFDFLDKKENVNLYQKILSKSMKGDWEYKGFVYSRKNICSNGHIKITKHSIDIREFEQRCYWMEDGVDYWSCWTTNKNGGGTSFFPKSELNKRLKNILILIKYNGRCYEDGCRYKNYIETSKHLQNHLQKLNDKKYNKLIK